MTDAERHFYDRGRYGEIAALVDRSLRIQSETTCTGGGCDGEGLCEAHRRAYEEIGDARSR